MYRIKNKSAAIELEVDEVAFEAAADTRAAEPVWRDAALPDPLFDVDLCDGTAAGA